MTDTGPANLQTQFVVGQFVTPNGFLSPQAQRLMLLIYNRTGGAPGVDMTYEVTQITLALTTAQAAQKEAEQAEVDAQTGIAAAKTAQATAVSAMAEAMDAQDNAAKAETDAQEGIANAAAAQETANTAVSDAEGVLIIALLTSSANQATAGHILDEATLLGVLNRTCPSQQ